MEVRDFIKILRDNHSLNHHVILVEETADEYGKEYKIRVRNNPYNIKTNPKKVRRKKVSKNIKRELDCFDSMKPTDDFSSFYKKKKKKVRRKR